MLIGGLFPALVAYVAGGLALAGTISVGDLVAAVGLTQFLSGPLQRIGYVGGVLARARASADRAAAVLGVPAVVTGGAEPAPGARQGRLDVLARRADPGSGRVTVDGIGLGDLALADAQRLVLVAAHDADLFEGRVAENVAAAAPGITPERRAAILAASAAEAGSAGDHALEAAADRAPEGRTALIVAHRLTQAAGADRIVVLDAGRIVEQGAHDELIAAGGRYASPWAAWTAARAA